MSETCLSGLSLCRSGLLHRSRHTGGRPTGELVDHTVPSPTASVGIPDRPWGSFSTGSCPACRRSGDSTLPEAGLERRLQWIRWCHRPARGVRCPSSPQAATTRTNTTKSRSARPDIKAFMPLPFLLTRQADACLYSAVYMHSVRRVVQMGCQSNPISPEL
jgi:hypothetical protein